MWFNPLVRFLLRMPLHVFMSSNTLLLEYTGMKTGKKRSTPLNYLPLGDRSITTSVRQRVWWRNLRDGQSVSLLIKGRSYSARPEVVEQEQDVIAGLRNLFTAHPSWGRYYDVQVQAGLPDEHDLARAAQDHVLVYWNKLTPT